MLDSEREKLSRIEGEYVSIGITEDGEPRGRIAVPWEKTAHAFNMKTPKVYFSVSDLLDGTVQVLLEGRTVIGCYIFAPLEDYGFLSHFPTVRDLYILNGDSIRSLDFLRGLDECGMLFLQGARLPDLDVILDAKRGASSIFGAFRCVALYDCEVTDLSGFERETHLFSEFLVFGREDEQARKRWGVVSASTKRYFEIED